MGSLAINQITGNNVIAIILRNVVMLAKKFINFFSAFHFPDQNSIWYFLKFFKKKEKRKAAVLFLINENN